MTLNNIQLPLLSSVTRGISWVDLFGFAGHDITPEIRRERWEEWKSLADDEAVEYWTSAEGCVENGDCLHRDGDWCKSMDLPICVNPILTMRHGMIGMACMGAGHEPLQPADAANEGEGAK